MWISPGSFENCTNQTLGDSCAAPGINHVNSLQMIPPAPASRPILKTIPGSWPEDTPADLGITRSVVLNIPSPSKNFSMLMTVIMQSLPQYSTTSLLCWLYYMVRVKVTSGVNKTFIKLKHAFSSFLYLLDPGSGAFLKVVAQAVTDLHVRRSLEARSDADLHEAEQTVFENNREYAALRIEMEHLKEENAMLRNHLALLAVLVFQLIILLNADPDTEHESEKEMEDYLGDETEKQQSVKNTFAGSLVKDSITDVSDDPKLKPPGDQKEDSPIHEQDSSAIKEVPASGMTGALQPVSEPFDTIELSNSIGGDPQAVDKTFQNEDFDPNCKAPNSLQKGDDILEDRGERPITATPENKHSQETCSGGQFDEEDSPKRTIPTDDGSQFADAKSDLLAKSAEFPEATKSEPVEPAKPMEPKPVEAQPKPMETNAVESSPVQASAVEPQPTKRVEHPKPNSRKNGTVMPQFLTNTGHIEPITPVGPPKPNSRKNGIIQFQMNTGQENLPQTTLAPTLQKAQPSLLASSSSYHDDTEMEDDVQITSGLPTQTAPLSSSSASSTFQAAQPTLPASSSSYHDDAEMEDDAQITSGQSTQIAPSTSSSVSLTPQAAQPSLPDSSSANQSDAEMEDEFQIASGLSIQTASSTNSSVSSASDDSEMGDESDTDLSNGDGTESDDTDMSDSTSNTLIIPISKPNQIMRDDIWRGYDPKDGPRTTVSIREFPPPSYQLTTAAICSNKF